MPVAGPLLCAPWPWTTSRRTRALTLAAACKKAPDRFVGWLSPAREWPIAAGLRVDLLPLNALALVGLVARTASRGPGHALVVLLFASFVLTTAVFWAHTSHRSFLHVFEIIYAASVIAKPLRTYALCRTRRRGISIFKVLIL